MEQAGLSHTLAGLNKDQVSTTNRCYFDVNEFSTAAY